MRTLPPSELSFVIRDVGLGMTVLESFVNGIYTMIFAYTLWLICSRSCRHHKSRRLMVTIIIVLYALSTAHLASRWAMIRRAFVVDGSTEDTILISLQCPPTWIVVLATLTVSLMTLIADCVMIWRCWAIWGRDWRVPIAPLLATIIGSAFCALSLMDQIKPQDRYKPSNRTKFTNSGIVYFSLSLTSTVMSTTLIIYRIVTVSRRAHLIRCYRGIVEIIAESAALYAIAMIVFLPFFSQKNFTQGYAQAILIPITGIAPTIVTARVSLGLSQEYDTSKTVTPSLTNCDSFIPHSPAAPIILDSSTGFSPSGTRDNDKRCPDFPPNEHV
ncbi:hypothetical protein D9756_010817 [Leucocoprinus leucothites]|uniref:Uncharacterized protein n=1 Tax=Leucocoprinus leucothites TaxID=201217 RepID=A0A8H5FRH0_9AGAR|nr:hypothetical protein D9756_010817 [Leucoagaricus leucothites]